MDARIFLRANDPLPIKASPINGNHAAKNTVGPLMGGINIPLPDEPLVEIVRFDVTALLPGVTESGLKLQAASEGLPPQERVTGFPNAALTDDTVTVMVAVVWPLAVEIVVGESDTEKSAGAAPIFATNPSATPPP
jgi:hypothetical protein